MKNHLMIVNFITVFFVTWKFVVTFDAKPIKVKKKKKVNYMGRAV